MTDDSTQGWPDQPAGTPPGVTLRLLGVPAARAAGRWWPLERHDALLLAALALEGPQPRTRAAALLWPDAEPSRGLANLRQRLYRLRRRLGHALTPDTGALALLDDVQHDLADPASDDLAADQALLAALDFSDQAEVAEMLGLLRDRWTAARMQALESRADALERAGRHDEALRVAERLVAASPASDHAHRRCIRLHYLRGDVAQALVAVARCRERLQALVGIGPGAETESLAALVGAAARPALSRAALPALAWQRPPRLVGRQQPWALLESACAAGLVVLLRGDAGVGKTRLATEFGRQRGPLLAAKADPADAELPLALVRRLLQAGTPSADTGPVPWRRLAHALQRWSEQARATVFIDDLQWADAASLEALLDALALGRPPHLPVLLGVRDGAVPAALQAWLARLPAGQWLDLPLAPLDEEAVRDLLDDLGWPGVPPHRREQMLAVLAQRAAGHPLLLLELLRTRRWGQGASSPPDSRPVGRQLQAMLGRRLGRLDPTAQAVLRVAACAGPAYSLPLAAQVLAQPVTTVEAAWAELAREQLLQDDLRLLDAVAEAARQATPVPLAMATHRALAQALAAQAEPAEHVAHHWQQAGAWVEAASAFAQAAQAHAGRQAEALLLWDRCAACHQQAGDGAAAAAAAWSALEPAVAVEGERDLMLRIERLRALAHEPSARLRLLLVEARARINAAAGPQAQEPARQAQALAVQLGRTAAALEAAAWLALATALAGDVADARRLLEQARQVAGEAPDPLALQHWAGSLGYVLHLAGDHAQASRAFADAAAIAERAGADSDAFEHVANHATSLTMQGRTADARAAGEHALALWRRLGEPASLSAAVVHAQVAAVELAEGRFDRALELLNWALQAFRRQGSDSLAALTEHRLANAWMRMGQPQRARQVFTPLSPQADAGRRVMREMLLVRLDGVQGERALARLHAARGDGPIAASDSRALRLHIAQHAAPADALVLAEAVAAEATADGDAPAAAHAHARAALACVQLGRLPAAAQHACTAWASGRDHGALDTDRPQLCAWVRDAAAASSEHRLAHEAQAAGEAWLRSAWPHVPKAWRPGLLRRAHALGLNASVESAQAAPPG